MFVYCLTWHHQVLQLYQIFNNQFDLTLLEFVIFCAKALTVAAFACHKMKHKECFNIR